MKKHFSRKRVVLAAIVVVALAIASGVAYAYWTSGGSGSGSAAAATASNFDVDVNLATGIHPGGTAAITGTVTNNTSTDLQLNSVDGDTVPVTVDGAHSSCVVGDFTVGALAIAGGSQILTASGDSTTFSGDLAMANTALNQDGCQGATLTLHLVAS